MSLFRKEALQAQSNRLEGDILLAQSWSTWVVFWLILALIVVTVSFLFLSSYTKRAPATGQLMPTDGAIFISTPGNGTITNVYVKEGQKVTAGTVMFTIKDERYISSSIINSDKKFADSIRATLKDEENALIQEQGQVGSLAHKTNHSLQRQLKSLEQEILQMEQLIVHHTERYEIAKQKYSNHKELTQSGFVSLNALAEIEDTLSLLQTQASSYQKELANLQSRKIELENELNSAPIKNKITLTAIDTKLSLLRQKTQERDIQSKVDIVAPITGVVTGITAHVGDISGKQPLAVLLPENSQLVAHLYLTSKEVGFAEIGQKVNIRYQAFPYQKFGQSYGKLAEISRSPISREILPAPLAASTGTDFYRAIVKLDTQYVLTYSKQKRLVSGMLLEADIEQDRRRLIEWIFEPLYAFRKYQ